MGLERDILRTLRNRSRTFDELHTAFPQTKLSEVLIGMEGKRLIENKNGTWIITTQGQHIISRGGKFVYGILLVPALVFFLLAGTFYTGYSETVNETTHLLDEKSQRESERVDTETQKPLVQAEYDEILSQLEDTQDETARLMTSHETVSKSLNSLHEELNYYTCLETSTPDTFVTVDNAYLKGKVNEITSGLASLKEKQIAIYEFVRDEIADDEYNFRTGRLDLWEYPEDILKRGKGHFEDKFLLLLTMLRIAGTPADQVKFIAADVDGNDSWVWVEAYDGSEWWILDPFEGYTFTENPRDEFYKEHEVTILWWFNDAGIHRG
jgi:transglutaminase-like putative cysteine protease